MAREDIQRIAGELKIPYLVHFTRASNLLSILQHGLHPIHACQALGIAPDTNDCLRLDGRLNGISLSIAHPNGKMFYRLRKENPDTEWVILALDPKILWERDALFCQHNAADARISGTSSDTLRSADAFRGMFAEIEGHPSRASQVLRAFDPTDVQAEVLVMEAIQPIEIFGVAFDNAGVRARFDGALTQKKVITNGPGSGLFAERSYRRRGGG